MPNSCIAYGCSNRGSTGDSIIRKVSFHKFPIENPLLLKQWLIKIRRQDFVPKPSSRICSDHFEEECFTYQLFTNKRLLKQDAVPTIFAFNKKSSVKLKEYYFGREADPGDRSSTDNLESTIAPVKLVDREVQTDMSFVSVMEELYSLRQEVKMLKSAMNKCALLKMLSVSE